MTGPRFGARARRLSAICAVALAAGLTGCSMMPSFFGGGSEKPKPAELPPNAALIGVRPAWTARVGEVNLPLSINVNGGTVAVASSDGTVAVIDAATGRDLWRVGAGGPLAAGVGSDGKLVAVVSRANELVALSSGKEAWRQKMPAVILNWLCSLPPANVRKPFKAGPLKLD